MSEKAWLCEFGSWREIDDLFPVTGAGVEDDYEKQVEVLGYRRRSAYGDCENGSGAIVVWERDVAPPFMIEISSNCSIVDRFYAANLPSMFAVLAMLVPIAHYDWHVGEESMKPIRFRCERLFYTGDGSVKRWCVMERGHGGDHSDD